MKYRTKLIPAFKLRHKGRESSTRRGGGGDVGSTLDRTKIGLRAQNMTTNLGSIVNIIRGSYKTTE